MRLIAPAVLVLLGIGAPRLERDISYGSAPEQRLDLTTPDSHGFPTIVFVHGGSLTSGDKTDDDYRNVCGSFPSNGIACANVNYRLAPRSSWPAQAEDVASAIAWIHANIAQRGGDPAKIFLLGHSSGATLVALVGTDERYLAAHKLDPSMLKGVIPMGSIMYDADLDDAISRLGKPRVDSIVRHHPDYRMYASLDQYLDRWPMRHIHAGLPPFLFLIAEAEQVQPPVLATNSRWVDSARVLSNCASYRVIKGRDHYSAIHSVHVAGDSVAAIINEFVRNPRLVC